jgi:hypothetical protein
VPKKEMHPTDDGGRSGSNNLSGGTALRIASADEEDVLRSDDALGV